MLLKKLAFRITLFLFSILTIGASPVIKAEIDNASYDIGDEITVKIRIDENPGIKGLFFDLSYDSQKLEFLNLSKGLILNKISEENQLLYAHTDNQAALNLGGHLIVSWFMEQNGHKTFEEGTFVEISFLVKERGLPNDLFQFIFSNNKAVDSTSSIISSTIWQNSKSFILDNRGSDFYVNILDPENNEVLNAETAYINALYSGGTGFSLIAKNTINDYSSLLQDGVRGAIEDLPILLDEGSNRIILTLFDSYGAKVASDEINLIRSSTEKYIKIISPLDHALVNTNMVKIKVSSSFDNPKLNGMDMDALWETDSENTANMVYFKNFYLKEGFNTIKAEVRDDNDAVYKTESTIYYHKDDSVFQFVTPGSSSVLNVKEDASFTIKGEISSLIDDSYLENTVHIQAIYYPRNQTKKSQILVNMEQAEIKDTNIDSHETSSSYMFVLNHPVKIDELESGSIELVAYKNKRGYSVDDEIHRTFYIDNDRLYIDLVQPNIHTTDILDTISKIEYFNNEREIENNSINLNSEGAFLLDSQEKIAGSEAFFASENVSDIIRTVEGHLYALVNDLNKLKIYHKKFGEQNWSLVLEKNDIHGYDLCETDIGILVGVSNLYNNDNSGLYILQEKEFKNIIIGKPIPHVQFVNEDNGLISLYGNDYSSIYTFNIFSLEYVNETTLKAGITDDYPLDNNCFIKDFKLTSGGRTAIIQTLENEVYFYKQNDSGSFYPVNFQGGQIESDSKILKVVSGEYSDGDYNAYLLIEEDKKTASIVMEQRENRRFILQTIDLSFLTDKEQLIGVDFFNNLFTFVTYNSDNNEYNLRRRQILFNSLYPSDASSVEETYFPEQSNNSPISNNNLTLFHAEKSLLYTGFGTEESGLSCLRTEFPAAGGNIEFEYSNSDIEGLVSFSFEVESSWIESDLLHMGFAVGKADSYLFGSGDNSPASFDSFTIKELLVETDSNFKVYREYGPNQNGTHFELITVVFEELQADQDLFFNFELKPVEGISPEIHQLAITKKVPVKLPRNESSEIILPIHGYIYDPTVKTVKIGTTEIPLVNGQFSDNYTISTINNSADISIECLNGADEKAELFFTVQFFNSVNSLDDIAFSLPESIETLPFIDGSITVENETIEVSGSYEGLIGAVTGFRIIDIETNNILRTGVFENTGIVYSDGGIESGNFTNQKIKLFPDEQKVDIYVENPGGIRSSYEILDDQLPILNYNLPQDEQEIELLNFEIETIEEGSETTIDGINFNREFSTIINEDLFADIYAKTLNIRGQVKSQYDLQDLKVKSFNSAILFNDGTSEIIIPVDPQGRFNVDLNITLPENMEQDKLEVAFIPTAPFLYWLSSGLIINAKKSFTNSNVVPYFVGLMDDWTEDQIHILSKPVRVSIDRYIPENTEMELKVNYGESISGILVKIDEDENLYRLKDKDSGSDVHLHNGVKLENNRIQWWIYYNNHTVSSSATKKNGMEDFLFTLTGESTYVDTEVIFKVDKQIYYDNSVNKLPDFSLIKDENTTIELILNGNSLPVDNSSGSIGPFDFATDEYELYEGKNTLIVKSEDVDGTLKTFEYEFLYDTLSPLLQISGYTYNEDKSKLDSLTGIVTDYNLNDAVIIYQIGSVENEYNSDPVYTYLGSGRFLVEWDLTSASITPTSENHIFIRATDHANHSSDSGHFTGISESETQPDSVKAFPITIAIDEYYNSLPFFKDDLGTKPFDTKERVKFYSSSIGIENFEITGTIQEPYIINRPGSVNLSSPDSSGVTVSSGSLKVEAGNSVSLYPGFNVDAGSELHITPGSTIAGSDVEPLYFSHTDSLDSMSFVFYYRYEQEEKYYSDSDSDSDSDSEYKRILTLYDYVDGDGDRESVFLASKRIGDNDSKIGLFLFCQLNDDPEEAIINGSSLEITKETGTENGWNLILLSIDKTTKSFSLSLNNTAPINAVCPISLTTNSDIFDSTLGIKDQPFIGRHYFGSEKPAENGHYSIAQPFYVNRKITLDEVSELQSSLPADFKFPDYVNRREYNFDSFDDDMDGEFYNLTVNIDGQSVELNNQEHIDSYYSLLENMDYNGTGGSLSATTQHSNYLNKNNAGYSVFSDSEEPVYYNINASAGSGVLNLSPAITGTSGRYFFSKKQGNHGLTNNKYYSVYGTVFTDGIDEEAGDKSAKAWIALLIDGKEERVPLLKGNFHLVFNNNSNAVPPSSVKIYIETTEDISIDANLVLTEGDYVLPPEAYSGLKSVSTVTSYSFSPEGTINLWYKPVNINKEGFASYPVTIFDSEFVKIYTKLDGGITRFEADIKGGANHSPIQLSSNVPVTTGWHNLQVSYDITQTNGKVYFYVDGEIAASLFKTFTPSSTMSGLDSNSKLVIGSALIGDNTNADGFIDSVSISRIYKESLYESYNPVTFEYIQTLDDFNNSSNNPNAFIEVEAKPYVNAENIIYALTSRDGTFRQIKEPDSVLNGEFNLNTIPSGAYNFKASMNINDYRYDKRFSFIKDNRPNFSVNGSTPLIIDGIKGDIIFEVSFDESYMLQSNEGIEPGFALQLMGQDSQTIFETIYVYRDPASADQDVWLCETDTNSGSPQTISIVDNQLQIIFPDIMAVEDIEWELKSFYFDTVFSSSTYDFERISEDNQNGSISIAALEVNKIGDSDSGEIEHKLEIIIGNENGGQLSEELLSKLSVSINIIGSEEISPFELEGTVLEVYYEDILPDFGEYNSIISLRYENETCNSRDQVLNWISTEDLYEGIETVDKRLEIVDFALLYLDKTTEDGEITSTAKLYLEFDQNGIDSGLQYDIAVYSKENDVSNLFGDIYNNSINGSEGFVIIQDIVIPQDDSLISINLYEQDGTTQNLLTNAELVISNKSQAPEVVLTNTVSSRIAYNNVLLTWKGLLNGSYNSAIKFSYNFDKQGWSTPKDDSTTLNGDSTKLELFNLEEGYHVFQLKGSYDGVESVIQSVPFFVDTNKPVFNKDLIVVYPLYDTKGIISSVLVSGDVGAVSDISLSSMYINGKDSKINDDGSFEQIEVVLEKDGENIILCSAYDEVGNITEYEIIVENPVTEILFPGTIENILFAPVTVVGRINSEITSDLNVYLADPETGKFDLKDLSNFKKAKINNDRTFFIEDVYVNPGTYSRDNETVLHLLVETESGQFYTKDLAVHANELIMPIEMEFSTHAVEGENSPTEVSIDCTAYVENISSWSIDYTGDGIYDEITTVDNPSNSREISWNHSYSSLGLVTPRVRIITTDGNYFSVSDQIIIHEQITESSNLLIENPLSMSTIRLEDGSDRVYVLAGTGSNFRIEVYEIGRNANYISDKLYSISLDGLGIDNPVSILTLDKGHIYIGANSGGNGYVYLLEANEFENFINITECAFSIGNTIKEIEADNHALYISVLDSNYIAKVPLEEKKPQSELMEKIQINNEYLAEVGGNLALANQNDGLIVADYNRNRILSLDSKFNITNYYDDFGSGEREFIKPLLVESSENRILIYDEIRKDIQVFDNTLNSIATLKYSVNSENNYIEASSLYDLRDMSLVTRNEGNRLFYYTLVLSGSTNKLSMIRLPQWEELRASVRNNKIVFLKDKEIFTAKPDGSDLTRILTSDSLPRIEGTLDYPAISPDGRTIVFTSRVELYDGNGESPAEGDIFSFDNLYKVDISGENLTRIPLGLIHNYEIERPVFSSNGDKIIFSAKESGGNWQIYTYNLTTGGIVRLFNSDENARFPYYSPDDRFIVFTTDYDGDEDVVIIDVENVNMRVAVTNNNCRDSYPVWSVLYPFEISNSDLDINSKIAFVSERDFNKSTYFTYISRPSDSDIRIVKKTGEETGSDPDSAATKISAIADESDYPSFTGDGASVVFEYLENWEAGLLRYDFKENLSTPMNLPKEANKPSGMKNMIVDFNTENINGNDLLLSWTPYTDQEIFYTVQFRLNNEAVNYVEKKFFTKGNALLNDLEMGSEYLMRVCIIENGADVATSLWKDVIMPEVAAIASAAIDEVNPYMVHLSAWKADEDTRWEYTWIIDNQEFPVQSAENYPHHFSTSGNKTIVLKVSNLSKTQTSYSNPITVNIISDIIPSVEYVLDEDSAYIELSALNSAGDRIIWDDTRWIISGSGAPPLAAIFGSQTIIPVNMFKHKININLTLTRQHVNNQTFTDTIEKNLTVDLDFKDAKPVITYDVNEADRRMFIFSGSNSIGNIDWYNAVWTIFGDGVILHQQNGKSSTSYRFPESGSKVVYSISLTVPRVSDGKSETTTQIVSVEPAPIEPVIEYEILTLEEGDNTVGVKVLFSCSNSKGSSIDFSSARWSVPIAGEYSEQPTQIGPTAIYNLFNLEGQSQVEVSLTLMRKGGSDIETITELIYLRAKDVSKPKLIVKTTTEATSTGHALVFDTLSSKGPNIDWEKTQWLFDGAYAKTGPVARFDLLSSGEEQIVRYVCTQYRHGVSTPMMDQGEIIVGSGEIKPLITVSENLGNNVFKLTVEETEAVNVDWTRTAWYIFDGNENVVKKQGTNILHTFVPKTEAMGYPVLVEMFFQNDDTPFVGYQTIDIDGDELKPVITWDLGDTDGDENVIHFSAQASSGSAIDWSQVKWTFGDSSESQYGSTVAHKYPIDSRVSNYKVSLTLLRKNTNANNEAATVYKTISIGSNEIKPVMKAELRGDGYLVLTSENSEGRGLLLDRTSWLFEGEGDSLSTSSSEQTGTIRNSSWNNNISISAGFSSPGASGGPNGSGSCSGGTSGSTTSYDDYINSNASFSTSNSHIGATCRRYVGNDRRIVVTMFVYRMEADGSMKGESITVNVDCTKAAQNGGFSYE